MHKEQIINNFEKDINVPSKEQIMIDGVDVNKCKHFCLEQQIPDIPLAGFSKICGEEYIAKECKDNPDCYFKQLARKTQECEQKEKEINELHLIIDRLLEASGYDKNISTAEDFEDVYSDIDYKVGLLEELKQECGELKEVNSRLLQRLEVDDFDTGIVYRQELELQYKENEFYMAVKNLTRYRKALEEIEGIVNETCIDSQSDCKSCNFSCEHKDILDIINKAKGEE